LVEARGRPRGVRDSFRGTLATGEGEWLWAFRCCSEGGSRSLLFTRDVRLLGQVYPGRQILRRVSDGARLVVCEPIGDLPAAWKEVLRQAAGDRKGHGRLLPFPPRARPKTR